MGMDDNGGGKKNGGGILDEVLGEVMKEVKLLKTEVGWSMKRIPIMSSSCVQSAGASAGAIDGAGANAKTSLTPYERVTQMLPSTVPPSLCAPSSNTNGSSLDASSTSPSSSSDKHIDDNVKLWLSAMQNSLPTREKLEARLESLVDQYVDPFYETMGQHYYSVSFGMFLGAAVATGVFVGGCMMLSTLHPTEPSIRRRNIQSPFRSFIRAYVRRAQQLKNGIRGEDVKTSGSTKEDGEKDNNDDNNSKKEMEKSGTAVSTAVASYLSVNDYNSVLLLRGDVGPRVKREDDSSASKQCQECLNNLSGLLAKHEASWKGIRKLTVYLVSQQCDTLTFRKALQEYLLKWDNVIITFVFVHSLEQEGAFVQVEAMVNVPCNQ
jgi:enamine deaminase RidA (YjgF/YER057c/UK114 family)